MAELINYFAYGELRDGKALEVLLGRNIGEGEPATLLDHELCIQAVGQIPDYVPDGLPTSARKIIEANYGPGFKTYMVRRHKGKSVAGLIYKVSKDELLLIDDWELREFAWYEQNAAIAQTTESNIAVIVHTDSTIPHPVERVVGGLIYPDLQDPEFMLTVAEKSRQESLERIVQSPKER